MKEKIIKRICLLNDMLETHSNSRETNLWQYIEAEWSDIKKQLCDKEIFLSNDDTVKDFDLYRDKFKEGKILYQKLKSENYKELELHENNGEYLGKRIANISEILNKLKKERFNLGFEIDKSLYSIIIRRNPFCELWIYGFTRCNN
mgnify:CR=1 FL=1